jgi:hypothetical protein
LTGAQNGSVKGHVINPSEEPVLISAYLDDAQEPATTTTSDEDGNYLLRGLAAGNYRIVFNAGGTTSPVEKTDITVSIGVVTELETVETPQ